MNRDALPGGKARVGISFGVDIGWSISKYPNIRAELQRCGACNKFVSISSLDLFLLPSSRDDLLRLEFMICWLPRSTNHSVSI